MEFSAMPPFTASLLAEKQSDAYTRTSLVVSASNFHKTRYVFKAIFFLKTKLREVLTKYVNH